MASEGCSGIEFLGACKVFGPHRRCAHRTRWCFCSGAVWGAWGLGTKKAPQTRLPWICLKVPDGGLWPYRLFGGYSGTWGWTSQTFNVSFCSGVVEGEKTLGVSLLVQKRCHLGGVAIQVPPKVPQDPLCTNSKCTCYTIFWGSLVIVLRHCENAVRQHVVPHHAATEFA